MSSVGKVYVDVHFWNKEKNNSHLDPSKKEKEFAFRA